MDYIDFYYSNKIKHKGAEHNRHMTDSMKRAIFFIRRYTELKNEAVNMCYEQFEYQACIQGHHIHRVVGLSAKEVINSLYNIKVLTMDNPLGKDNLLCFVTPELVVTTRVGVEHEFPAIFAEGTPEKLEAKFSDLNTFYVYVCRHEGKIIYVGKGNKDRFNHCISGSSSSPDLNSLVKRGENLTAEKVAENLSEEMAIHLEESYMRALVLSGTSLVNRQIPSDVREFLDQQCKTKDVLF